MEVIVNFEENVKSLVEDLKKAIGASSVEVNAIDEKYTKGVRTIVRFENLESRDATAKNRPANSGPAC